MASFLGAVELFGICGWPTVLTGSKRMPRSEPAGGIGQEINWQGGPLFLQGVSHLVNFRKKGPTLPVSFLAISSCGFATRCPFQQTQRRTVAQLHRLKSSTSPKNGAMGAPRQKVRTRRSTPNDQPSRDSATNSDVARETPLTHRNQGGKGNILSADLSIWREIRCLRRLNLNSRRRRGRVGGLNLNSSPSLGSPGPAIVYYIFLARYLYFVVCSA